MTSQPGDTPAERDERPLAAGDERVDATAAGDAVPASAPAADAQRATDSELAIEPEAGYEAETAADADFEPDAEPDAEHDLEPELVDRVEQDDVEVKARLVPRYGRFMGIGLVLGAIGGWLWSRLGGSGPFLGSGPVVDTSAVVPFLVGVGALAGLVLGSVVAILLDRIVGRRSRTVTAERTRHRLDDAA